MTLSFSVVQNNDIQIEMAVTREDGTIIDLTGCTIKWALVDTDGNIKASKSTVSGITITDATSGEFTIFVDKEDIDDYTGTFIHEAVITDTSGNVSTITTEDNCFGQMTIRKQYVLP